jgi:hypothetical protein
MTVPFINEDRVVPIIINREFYNPPVRYITNRSIALLPTFCQEIETLSIDILCVGWILLRSRAAKTAPQ